jgi:hypothetical protein
VKRKLYSVWLSLVLLALAASPALADSSSGAESIRFTVDRLLANPCPGGEALYLQGDLHMVIRSDIVNGKQHYRLHYNQQNIVGTGLTTGTEYRVSGTENTTLNWEVFSAPVDSTQVVQVHIIGQGTDADYLLRETFHVTVNANGELTASLDDMKLTCP